MNNVIRLGGAIGMSLALIGNAHAVFSGAVSVPEPEALGLLVAGGIGVMTMRLLARRKDKRDE